MIDINSKDVLHEVNLKLVKHGNLWNVLIFKPETNEWKPLMSADTLYSSVLGALESELGHLARKL